MYSSAAIAVVALAARASAQGTGATVTTPTSLVECQPAQFTVSGGQAPYFLSIIPGGQSGAAPLENLPQQNAAGSVTWNVDLAAGTSISIQVRDSTGALNYSQQVTIQPGSSTSCVNGNASGGASSGASSAAPSASGPASSAASGASSAASSAASRASSAVESASSRASSVASSISSAVSSATAGSSASSAPSSSSSSTSGSEKIQATAFGAFGVVAALFGALFA